MKIIRTSVSPTLTYEAAKMLLFKPEYKNSIQLLHAITQRPYSIGLHNLFKAAVDQSPEKLKERDLKGRSCLWSPCYQHEAAWPAVLKDQFEQLDIVARNGETLFHAACRKTNAEVTVAAIGNCSSININRRRKNDGQTALHLAVQNDDLNAVIRLIGFGADPLREDTNNSLPIDYAAQKNNLALVKAVDPGGIDYEKTMMHTTDPNVVAYCLKKMSLDQRPMRSAIFQGLEEVAIILFSQGQQALCPEWIFEVVRRGMDKLILKVIKNVDLKMTNTKGQTLFHIACGLDSTRMLHILNNHWPRSILGPVWKFCGYPPSWTTLQDKVGKTPLDYVQASCMQSYLKANFWIDCGMSKPDKH